MQMVPVSEFLNRVVVGKQKVQFSHIDPYGHLNTSRYVEFVLNHRIDSVEEQQKLSTIEILKAMKMAFVVARMDTRFLSPSYIGEELEIGTWISRIRDDGFDVSFIVAGTKNNRARAAGRMEVVSVAADTGRPIDLPPAFPVDADVSPLPGLVWKDEYLTRFRGVHDSFF